MMFSSISKEIAALRSQLQSVALAMTKRYKRKDTTIVIARRYDEAISSRLVLLVKGLPRCARNDNQ
jgi:hypothetical protein